MEQIHKITKNQFFPDEITKFPDFILSIKIKDYLVNYCLFLKFIVFQILPIEYFHITILLYSCLVRLFIRSLTHNQQMISGMKKCYEKISVRLGNSFQTIAYRVKKDKFYKLLCLIKVLNNRFINYELMSNLLRQNDPNINHQFFPFVKTPPSTFIYDHCSLFK